MSLFGADEDGLMVGVSTTEESISLDDSALVDTTLLEFPDFHAAQWDVFCAEISRYTLRVVFIQQDI